ncbi:esterase-like activity of phytase family protein [Brachybacterium sp. ACRRE]|uniref:esterase-like activity of phytase family protein n=1 Tax=Brachybacterium sp. ACRRE TaxID=2918184 RepID=UPI001EF2D57B|nr:esterase-like activity of phytase family protein [Brachybacterium sp. ACRRE]MCG7307990.1 esterase-like activity of phytase family protein [Brachybacterium sp. ACRRE]
MPRTAQPHRPVLLPRLAVLGACTALCLGGTALVPFGQDDARAQGGGPVPAHGSDGHGAGSGHGKGHGSGEGHGTDGTFFTRTATMPAYANTSKDEDAVAEISTVTSDGRTVVSTDSAGGTVGFTDISDPDDPKPLGATEVDGEPTSVHAVGSRILVVVDDTDGDLAHPAGHVSVLDARTREEVRRIDLGGQPDSIDVTADGRAAVIAIENQRDEETAPAGGEKGDLPQAPTGWLSVIDLQGSVSSWDAQKVDLGTIDGAVAPEDLEPEYVKVSPDDTRVAVTLQENNAIAIVDIDRRRVVSGFSAGTATVKGVDATDDGDIDASDTITDVPREPDGIGWIDDEHVATADEGDWKGGSRTWSIFDARTGEVTWDSGNPFEQIGVSIGQYPESRSDTKGTEPEGLAVADYGDRRLAFVGSERGNYVAVYDVTDPAAPVYQQALSSTPGPEGILPIPERNLVVVSSEEDDADARVRASLQVYRMDAGRDEDRTIVSADDPSGSALPWGALSDLSAVPGSDREFLSVSDSGFTTSALFRIDASSKPAVVRERLALTRDGAPLEPDLEGVTALDDGTAWVAAEGARDADTGDWSIENSLMHVDAQGRVTETVPLPDDVAKGLKNRGFEGVTATSDGRALVAVIQGVVDGDPDDTARVARYDLASKTWSYWGYRLGGTDVAGDQVGLSAITDLGHGRFAVIERDSLNGPDAARKQIVTFTLPGTGATGASHDPPSVKRQGEPYDLLPLLRSTDGWTQEKVESLAVADDGGVYVVTDNDALEDANGETLFARAGWLVDGRVQSRPGDSNGHGHGHGKSGGKGGGEGSGEDHGRGHGMHRGTGHGTGRDHRG